VFADLKQNAPGRGRTLLLICVVIEAMITLFAVLDNTRIGWVSQSLLPGIGGGSLYFMREPGREAVSLSTEPLEEVRDSVFRVLSTLAPDNTSLSSGFALLQGMKISPLILILETGKLHRCHAIPSGRVGV
jgi:hypothetical protein